MAGPTAPNPSVGAARRPVDPLRVSGVIFAIALAVHGADHFRRGMDVITPEVFWLGNVQIALSIVTLVLVFRGHRWAPAFAVVTGFASAIGFSAAHLLPHWSVFSDAFTGAHPAPGVTVLSWFAAMFEIVAGLTLGVTGLRALRARTA